MEALPTPGSLERALAGTYVADARTAQTVWLALRLGRPILLEGPAGVGKTDLARALSKVLERPLLRLQCYEGLDEAKALYEWDYGKQMLFAQMLRTGATAGPADLDQLETTFFDRRFLIKRPLLAAIDSTEPVVLLVDEVDRADPEFEALLLEVLAESQITIPEIGTIQAAHPPLCVLTSNGTREMTDALRRRCLHLFLDYPTPARELEILALHVPGLEASLAQNLVALVEHVRGLDLKKAPSVAETLDWARALVTLGKRSLDAATVAETLSTIVKHQADRDVVERALPALLQATAPSPKG